ncbi:YtxH domain-containing protein [Candidatus Parcubacteria bacterium]|nr:YtxH domain-containing protein [Candidatus Parcubacteria bacterium]
MIKKSKIALGAAVAVASGYVAGVLTAPKSGKQTRKDISKKASKAKTDGERQLKKLHSELSDSIAKAEKNLNDSKTKANKSLNEAVAKAKETKNKAKMLLSALHHGDADDPDLKKMIADAKQAKTDLVKYLKK